MEKPTSADSKQGGRAKCTGCGHEFTYEPRDVFSGVVFCPKCVTRADRID
jgi:Zn finger protein HypA/HybF involved in hydrogenase expression